MPLGDILAIKEEYKKVGDQISEIVLKNFPRKEKLIVAVGGESGCGKSEIAYVISDNLFKSAYELRSFILHVDDFFLLPRKERNELRVQTKLEFVGISEINQDELAYIIKKFKEDTGLTLIPIYDILTSTQYKLVVNFQNIPVLIAEGLYANSIEADYNIFIDRTYHDTKKFQIERGKEVMDEFRFGVLEREHQAVSQLRKRANFIINKDYSLAKR
jgi:uridine kinase